jgi:hypothetical protein
MCAREPRRHPAPASRWTIAGLAAVGLLTMAACAPSTGTSAPSSSNSPTARGQAMQAYRQCMTQHGVTFPDRHNTGGGTTPSTTADVGTAHRQPGTPPPGVNPQTWNAARTACANLAPHRTPAPSTPGS